MKISVITATYNSAATVADTLKSVAAQDYPHIEHICVDGLSKDNTVDIIKSYPHVAKWVSEKDKGLYDAINKGIRMATGDVVGILNSDDFFPSADVYAAVAFVNPGNMQKVIRHYSSAKFRPAKFKYGYMPAHPSFYAKKELFEKIGYYQTDYKIAADYELLMRMMFTHKINSVYVPKTFVYMRTGGVSNQTLKSRYVLNREIVRACRENGVQTNMVLLSLKYFSKVGEYIKPALGRSRQA
jgi:glycosyltransferase involved in cell wall biosynthesis